MEMRVDGIIFDVDGTLWDSTEIVAGAWNQAIIEEGITDVHLTGEILKGLFGKTMDVIAKNILPEATEEQRSVSWSDAVDMSTRRWLPAKRTLLIHR